jgi:hypothetical protein
MISLLTLATALASIATAAPVATKPGLIRGVTEAQLNGYRLVCRGVLLIPQSAAVDRLIAAEFGNLDEAARRVTSQELLGRFASAEQPVPGAREKRCYTRFNFGEVAPGDYYVVATMVTRPSFGDALRDGPVRAIDLMQRVRVMPGETVKLSLRDTNLRARRQ